MWDCSCGSFGVVDYGDLRIGWSLSPWRIARIAHRIEIFSFCLLYFLLRKKFWLSDGGTAVGGRKDVPFCLLFGFCLHQDAFCWFFLHRRARRARRVKKTGQNASRLNKVQKANKKATSSLPTERPSLHLITRIFFLSKKYSKQ